MRVLPSILVACLVAGAHPVSAAARCEPRDLGFDRAEAGWKHQPMSKLKRDTAYSIAKEEGRTVLRASAEKSASLFASYFKPPAVVPASLSWRWKADALVPGADNRVKDKEDSPLRVVVAFDGDKALLPAEEKRRFEAARKLTGANLPFAVLMYVWSDHGPVDAVIDSAHTSQVKMIAVASGSAGLGKWQPVKRDLARDYRRAYGAEPGALLGVAVMTDTDNTGAKSVGYYADLRLECAAP